VHFLRLRFLKLRYFFRSEGAATYQPGATPREEGKAVFPALKGRDIACCFALSGLVTCRPSQTQGDALG
jgi:hypothetical protein